MSIFSAIGGLVGAGANLIAGRETMQAQQANNLLQLQEAKKNRELQQRFAKEGIRWRVEDAKAAGIHPLYALGAQTHSFSPVTAGTTAETGFASGMAAAGQDIGRAIQATRTADERIDAHTLTMRGFEAERAKLQNEVLRTELASRIARMSQASNPPMATAGNKVPTGEFEDFNVPVGKKEANDPLMFGRRWATNPRWSPAQSVQNVYGEPAEWVYFPIKAAADLRYNVALAMQSAWQSARRTNEFHWVPKFEWKK